jgi:predicted transcriptional regulator
MDDNIIMQYEPFSDDIICSSDFYKNPESITDFMKRCSDIVNVDNDITRSQEEIRKFTDGLEEKYKNRLKEEDMLSKSAD